MREAAAWRRNVSATSSCGEIRFIWEDWTIPSLNALSILGLAVRWPSAQGVMRIVAPIPTPPPGCPVAAPPAALATAPIAEACFNFTHQAPFAGLWVSSRAGGVCAGIERRCEMDTQFLVEVLVLIFNALGACWMVEMSWRTA